MAKRIDALDFWRGVVLAAIFVNHLPDNVFSWLTPRNYSFSDAAEAFVFMSGISCVLAYARRFEAGDATAAVPVLRRVGWLYAVHLGLTAAGILLFAVAAKLSGNAELLDVHGRGLPIFDPASGILGVVALTHQLGYFNILPLYVVLLAVAPLLILVGLRDRWLMLLGSATVYVVARAVGLNLPSWPAEGGWYFNPFAWQLIFAVGIFVGLTMRRGPIAVRPSLLAPAILWCSGSALVVTNGLGFLPGLVDQAGLWLDWDKSVLGTARFIDFIALAYVLYCTGITRYLRRTPIYAPLSTLGRNSLTVFCVGTLLSSVGQIVDETVVDSTPYVLVLVVVGLWVQYRIASFQECSRRVALPVLR